MIAVSKYFFAVALLSTIGCGPLDGDVSCSPAPQISSSPPATAVVGQQYVYYVAASYLCGLWSICNNIDGIQIPPGAVIDDFTTALPGHQERTRRTRMQHS